MNSVNGPGVSAGIFQVVMIQTEPINRPDPVGDLLFITVAKFNSIFTLAMTYLGW